MLSLFVIAALLLSVCQPIQKPVMQSAPAVPAEPHGLRFDAPPYAIHGPYAVGVRNFEIDATKRKTNANSRLQSGIRR